LSRKDESSALMHIHRVLTSLASVELWVVGAAVFASILYPPLLAVAVFVAACFWPLRRLTSGTWTIRTPADIPVVLLLLMSVISLWITPLPQITAPQVYRLLSGIALYYTIANTCRTRRRLRLLLWVFSLSGLAVALLAPLSVEWPLGKWAFVPAALYQSFAILVADTVHPNVVAGTLALILPLAVAWLLFDWHELKNYQRVILLISTGCMSAVILISLSRGAWVACGLAGLALVILRWRWGWAAVGLGLLAAIAGVYWLGVERALDMLAASKTVGSLTGRQEVWGRAIDMILDFPFTGIGMGAFQPLADQLYPFQMFGPAAVFHAHNLFLQVAVDLGITGLLAWLGVLGVVIFCAGQSHRVGGGSNDALITALGAGILGSQIALIAHGLTDAVSWGMVRSAPLVWAVWGAAIAAALQSRQLHEGGLWR
jgi:putative inorganic carbon (HCO3(-)) transporter